MKAEEAIFRPWRGFGDFAVFPTAHAVGYCLSLLRSFSFPNGSRRGEAGGFACRGRPLRGYLSSLLSAADQRG